MALFEVVIFFYVLGGIAVGHLRSCVAKFIEVNEWFGYREEEWGVDMGRWDGGSRGSVVGWCVPNLGYVHG